MLKGVLSSGTRPIPVARFQRWNWGCTGELRSQESRRGCVERGRNKGLGLEGQSRGPRPRGSRCQGSHNRDSPQLWETRPRDLRARSGRGRRGELG